MEGNDQSRLKPAERPAEASGTDNLDEMICRGLRRKIQAHRIKRLGWSDYVFHYVMEGLGYGTSLKALGKSDLAELWSIIKEYRKSGRPAEFTYDKQGRYMYVLMRQAGWSEMALRAFMTIHFKKTHWNLLDKGERVAMIDALKNSIEIAKGEVHGTDTNDGR